VNLWQDEALNEKNPEASLNALLALARLRQQRTRTADHQRALRDQREFDENQTLEFLRDTEVTFSRMGKPSPEIRQKVIDRPEPALSGEDRTA